jgi:hypothetical protein
MHANHDKLCCVTSHAIHEASRNPTSNRPLTTLL